MTVPRFRRNPAIPALVLGVLVAGGACRDATDPAPPRDAPGSSAQLTEVSQDTNPSQMAVAQVVPGFGGYFLDDAGVPSVYLMDASQRPVAEQALAAFVASQGFTTSDLQVLQGSYEYAQLDSWYSQARAAAFSVAGIILGDVDEGSNRLRFGAADAGAVAGVQGALAQVGIPSGAAIVEQRAPITAVATLRDRVRPLVGGLQINFFPSPVSPVTLICTLGFNAISHGVSSFITNSHCSNIEGGVVTPTDYYQNLRSGGAANFIGVEVDDPDWTLQPTNPDCPPPFQCRYSDALRAQYTPAAALEASLGRIARIDEITTTLADQVHTIVGNFTIRAERADPILGEIANKVGRTTGWTRGRTTGTCIDVLALGTNHIRLCQAIVAALVDGGDSGSPVFFRRGGSNVTLLGILWGGSVDEANPEFVYSPMSGVERELGALGTF